jgi:oligopeptide/dipeptide ABC transporter ATP-binding protein
MYAGELVEISPMDQIYDEPLHPYTRLLIACLPSLEQKGTLAGIPGLPPSLLNPPAGCPFRPRCPHAMDRCQTERPVLQPVGANRWVACHLYGDAG